MSKGVKIFINDEKIKEHADYLGKEIWGENYSSLAINTINPNSNNQFFRLVFSVNDQHAQLDFNKNKNNGSTLVCSGKNPKLSQDLCEAFASRFCSAETKAQTCCFDNINEDSYHSLCEELGKEETIKKKKEKEIIHLTDSYSCIKITGYHGDSLTINFYKTNKLTLQGKPAYLMAMVLCHLSSLPEVTEKNILSAYQDLLKVPQDIQIEPYKDLEKVLPNAFSKLDPTILKILSTALALSNSNLTLADYSCYPYPALRALESLLITILNKRGIPYIPKNGFGSVFSFDEKTKKHTLAPAYKKHFQSNEQLFLESAYDYFKKHRHTLFHCENPPIYSRIISNHDEANDIIQEVIDYFEKAASEGVI